MNNKQPTFLMEVRQAEFYEGTIATDTPVMREGGEEEILVMHPSNIELHTKDLPLLENHDHSKQIGVVEDIRFVGKKLMAKIRFASDEHSQTLRQDVDDKIRQNLSIGYRILDYFYENGKKMVNKFSIHEVSLVPIPADQNSGIGRNTDLNYSVRNIEFKKGKEMTTRKERQEVSEIIALGDMHNLGAEAREYVENGNSLEQFRAFVLDNISNDEPLPTPQAKVPAFLQADQEYSVLRALQGIDDASKRGYEWEISKDLERSMPKNNPNSVILDTRTMTSGTAGANTIQTNVQSNIHDFMQQKSVAMNLGATTFGNNVGDLEVPLGTSASGATVIATDGTTQAAETTPTLSKLTLSPTRIADVVPLSYGFLQQSTPDVEAYVRRLIAQTFAKVMDEQIMAGSGSSGNVQGILGTSGINAVSNGGTEVTFANFVSAISELGADAVDLSNLKLIVNPANLDNLVTAVKYASTDSPILDMKAEADGRIGTFNGYPVFVTNAVTVDNYIMGDFRELAIASWGGIEISKNDFYDDRRFISSLNAIMSFDSGLLEPKAMCKITKA
ncbi:phage major capsid protein [Gammaproteobacteria bacterium]|nr:phage major capsid protein [Gammaproteobacteria bacterium]